MNFESGMIYISDRRLDKLRSSLPKTTSDNSFRIRWLASFVGQIISMGTAVGNIVRLTTCHGIPFFFGCHVFLAVWFVSLVLIV